MAEFHVSVFVGSRLAKRAVRGNVRGMRAVLRGVGDWSRDDPMGFQENE